MYSIDKIAKKLNIKYITAWARFHSKYAKQRWGVVCLELPDGSKKLYVPEGSLYLWQKDKYVTRPSKEELEQYQNNIKD